VTFQSGEGHALAKLTDEDVQKIRRRYAEGQGTYVSLADQYNVSSGTISAIIRGITWRHLL